MSIRPVRDRGSNLIEIVVTIGLIGILSVSLLAAIGVIFRTEDGVATMVTESHDVQQAVNYVARDIQSGPASPLAYRTAAHLDVGSGCSASGTDNILRIDYGTTFVAYRVENTTDTNARLDRYECNSDGSVREVINIADHLVDDGTVSPASANLLVKGVPAGAPEVDRVVIELQQSGGPQRLSGSPRAENQLADAVVAGDCTADPLEETLGFSTFIKGDVRFTNGPQIKWTSGIGGSLSFTGGVNVGQNINSDDELPSIEPFGTALYVHRVDWASTTGTLTMHSNKDMVIDDRSNTYIPGSAKSAYQLNGSPSNGEIRANGQSRIFPIDDEIDFDNAFEVLRSCSIALAHLPDTSCSNCAVHLEILDQNGSGPYPGVSAGTNMKLRMVPGKVNVLNVAAADFVRMKNMSFIGTSPGPNEPLIVNITDSGVVTLDDYPGQGGIGSWVTSTLWNFPNASEVHLLSNNDDVWGTIFAPLAHVHSEVKIEGGVVARSWTHDSREVNGPRVFSGTIDWDS
ncbi:choice-of-anchor A domain-containing protein [Ilumatobacter fluminis]|uniref:Choice-of-anchor A domain-containing protein n=1 Tax=Ilumatobacter fluminis TaxID=467091 RepID=A0A4R7HWJ0_9ACTN|nr:collagen-binding domain-containing protein [Ilumatobacter fluminis]TDT15462.1 choice-of-anchor A domain-containing protein [Ilumatobacter fluminis]